MDARDDRLLGVGIVGVGANEMIAEVLALDMGAQATDLMSTIHAHPTLSKTLMEAAEVHFGRTCERRRSLAGRVPLDSPCGLLRAALAEAVHPSWLAQDPRAFESFTFGCWSAVHGMAMLQLTHLRGFKAAFDAGSRAVLRSIAIGWKRPFAGKEG